MIADEADVGTDIAAVEVLAPVIVDGGAAAAAGIVAVVACGVDVVEY